MNIEDKVLDQMGRAMGRFAMLVNGDRVAVGVSGGKDSLTLLHALVAYKKRAPFPYEVIAVTVEQGKFKLPILALEETIRALGVEWIVRQDTATLRLIADNVPHGCDVCSRHRRHNLYKIVSEIGCSVLALGHTADDCAESLLRNILFNGRIASLPPCSQSRKGNVRLIRPLVYVTENLSREYARSRGFLPIACVCSEKESVRREIRDFLDSMKSRHVGISDSITAALGNVNLYTLFGENFPPIAASNSNGEAQARHGAGSMGEAQARHGAGSMGEAQARHGAASMGEAQARHGAASIGEAQARQGAASIDDDEVCSPSEF